MACGDDRDSGAKAAQKRKDRLAAELRRNLARRKAQSRLRAAADDDRPDGGTGDDPADAAG